MHAASPTALALAAVLPVDVPPLPERREDIGELALHLLLHARERTPGSPVRSISQEALEQLSRAEWPGNVREHSSTMDRLVAFGKHETVTRDDVSAARNGSLRTSSPPGAPAGDVTHVPCRLQELAAKHVASVLAHTEGDMARAAGIPGANLSTVYRWQHREAVKQ